MPLARRREQSLQAMNKAGGRLTKTPMSVRIASVDRAMTIQSGEVGLRALGNGRSGNRRRNPSWSKRERV